MRRLLLALLVAGGGFMVARASAAPFDDPGTASARPVLVASRPDLVTVAESATLSPAVEAAAVRAATQAGAVALPGRAFTMSMTAVFRGSSAIQAAAAGFRFPMATTVMPVDAARRLMSPQVSSTLAKGYIVMGQTTASLRGARVGDSIQVVTAGGAGARLWIGAVVPDSVVSGTEIVMSDRTADALGFRIKTRVMIWGFSSRAAIEATLRNNGLIRRGVNIGRSWWGSSPDSTLGLARTKALLGEFSFRVNSNSSITLGGNWIATHISGGGVRTTFAYIPIRAACNNAVRGAIQNALKEVYQSGLSGAIDVGNTNTYGGCFYPRYNRIGANIGSLSRHSWGQPIDMNTTQNVQGGVPHMDCRVVRIFRKWGFAWGGNFTTSDGMHFEYVGERRDQIQYPSTYCPNLPATATPNARTNSVDALPAPAATTQRDTMFANDGMVEGE
jgi:hypothetical protein